MILHPEHQAPAAALRERWSARRNLRLESVLAEEIPGLLLHALRRQEYVLRAGDGPLQRLYRITELLPDAACDHVLCRFGRWLHGDGLAWVEALTGMALAPSPDGKLLGFWYGKGAYLDPHNDFDGERAVAFVLGLSPHPWPAAEGGHLEFLDVRDGRIEVTERRPPGWNTLDLFDVTAPTVLHQVPILTAHHERRTITGWFYRRA